MNVLLFDIGGTNMRLSINEEGVMGEVRKVPTPKSPEDAITFMREFVGGQSIDMVSGGVAGAVDNGAITGAPNLPGWEKSNFQSMAADAFKAPAILMNDADVEGLGEALEGAGKNHQIVAYLTVGTGAGGTLVVDGALQPSAHGLEPGKQIIDFATGRTLEDLVSGAALARETCLSPKDIPLSVYNDRTSALAVGIYNLVRTWSPDIVVLGGAMILKEPGFSIHRIAIELTRIADGQSMPELVPATLGDAAGLIGALSLAS
ncbi:MAG TPA: ROK family protein [Candidatus Paceibacterota bacterium]|nr:ROK family protein [Candidatus Paceibacterota bacterium]